MVPRRSKSLTATWHEVTSWRCHPLFAIWWAALQEAIRLQSRPRALAVLQDDLKWFELLPVTMEVLEALQWWMEDQGRFICRHDSRHNLRRFELGVDSDKVLEEWLMEVAGSLQNTRPSITSEHSHFSSLQNTR